MTPLTVASLFCGCGGSDLGMLGGFDFLNRHYDALPFNIVYAADADQAAVDTYNSNFHHQATLADVTTTDFAALPEADVMIGGFPCQSFSTVNPTKDTNDERANLYRQIVRFLHERRPRAFVCENVKGLLLLQRGELIRRVVEGFEGEGYTVAHKLLRAVDYGIPQRRERVLIVGFRDDVPFRFAFPEPVCRPGQQVALSAVIDSLRPADDKYYFSARAVAGMRAAKGNMKRGLAQSLDKPCLTITSHLCKTSINSRDPVLLVDAEADRFRRFTPREAARIQSFPDSFRLSPSERLAYKQIGNAVPPVLMWHVARALATALCEGEELPPSARGWVRPDEQPTLF